MAVTDKHPQYVEYYPQWVRCRDVTSGEDAVKGKGEAYLPRLEGQDDAEYHAYKMRAMFYGAADRTVRGLCGAVMRKSPTLTGTERITEFLSDLGLDGESLDQLLKKSLDETISIGRSGILVDSPIGGGDPYMVIYCAESITNWRIQRVQGKRRLTMVVLHECEVVRDDEEDVFSQEEEEIYRVLMLVGAGIENEFGEVISTDSGLVYAVQTYRKDDTVPDGEETRWLPDPPVFPRTKGGKYLEEIPFIFVGKKDTTTEVDKSPLLDLVDVNLSHYRTSADLEHGRHFTALPTAWVAGFDVKSTRLRIGSTTAWVSNDPNAKAGFLEFSGAGLASLSEALKEKEKLMAVLGARLLEETKVMSETATAARLRQSGEQSILADIAQSVSEAFTRVLRWYAYWQAISTFDQIKIELNQDFNLVGIESAMLLALMTAVQKGTMSWDTYFWNLQRGEVVPDHRTADEEKRLIESGAPDKLLLEADSKKMDQAAAKAAAEARSSSGSPASGVAA